MGTHHVKLNDDTDEVLLLDMQRRLPGPPKITPTLRLSMQIAQMTLVQIEAGRTCFCKPDGTDLVEIVLP